MKFFDAHCHLQFQQYDADREKVLTRMRDLDMGAIVVGTNYETSKTGLELARRHDFIWASVGLHPNDEESYDVSKYEELAQDPKVVAIGECGLDYFRSKDKDQNSKFEAQIKLAEKLRKPLIVHCRNAHEDCSSILQKTRISVPVVMHFFTGTAELAQKYLELGCHISFPGPITFTDMYDESIRVTPMDKILAETDAPFAAPVPHRGVRNEPIYVEEVVKKIAETRGIPLKEMSSRIVENTQEVFGLQ
ncbi:hypothetical protein A2852_00810 [Candidatus Adlerbacteria bacterium RIFCSPHIGHO2_01_FULL_54_23]|uniref:Hydrolase TatD n=3 Tax=Candidatus Adleribacteriota TaxID=1752736 RepID=A0A1F4Y0D2_9BACT|nr:MAG: hypothetical protein UY83_C0003G0095 [Candidatus Adlerbacteria bacterium GW2011_GWA1_54_10]KKW36307.1 MAG: hypothetical protein UY84_C0001G0195 [Candidatus Adlerbacteria bacterium GW2011_GWA2_54_12]KKW37837.1 MAG: hypothetical protein UY86_C0003G0059 [Candidatus Adlerbacteria bacterium GW2011_GWB1_54_7]OGC78868.1 MAG: hypothetical protein A2852_00810 [Candidatus Adlerbacteria bacterium RIFCSPHIGHO2_01_FULL_54_23]OGC87246.1 MAG: hypothetical protein A3B33_02735 [Candidatus Adlerbacteria 